MGYRDYDDYDYDPSYIDACADRYFSRVYDSPEERTARYNPPKVETSDDGYDAQRDYNMEVYGNPKGLTEREMGQRWGSWDK